jgi:hypothetical protein
MESETENVTLTEARIERGAGGRFLPKAKSQDVTSKPAQVKPKETPKRARVHSSKSRSVRLPAPAKTPSPGKAKAVPTPKLDPARQALQDALDADAKAKAEVRKVKAALEALTASVYADPARLERCKLKITEAGVALARAMALGGEEDTSAERRARAELADAEAAATARKAARDQMREELVELQAQSRACEVEIDGCVSIILVPFAEALISKTKKLCEQVAPFLEHCSSLWSEPSRPLNFESQIDWNSSHAPLEAARKDAREAIMASMLIQRTDDIWADARRALKANPADKLESLQVLIGGKSTTEG